MHYLLLTVVPVVYADLHLDRPVVDLGELRGAITRTIRCPCQNTGTAPLEILAVDRSCGCLAVRSSTRRLAPGETGDLLLDVRSLGQPNGPHAWFAKIRYRQGTAERDVQLEVRARIRNEVTLQPTVLAFLGQSASRQEIVLTDLRDPPLKVAQVQCTLPTIQAEWVQTAGITKITVFSASPLPPGRHEGTLTIATNDATYPQFVVPITLTRPLSADVTCVPETVAVRPGPNSVLLRLRSAGEKAIVIDRVETADPVLQCTWASSEQGTVVRVRVDGDKLSAHRLPQGIRIFLREPNAAMIAVPVEKP